MLGPEDVLVKAGVALPKYMGVSPVGMLLSEIRIGEKNGVDCGAGWREVVDLESCEAFLALLPLGASLSKVPGPLRTGTRFLLTSTLAVFRSRFNMRRSRIAIFWTSRSGNKEYEISSEVDVAMTYSCNDPSFFLVTRVADAC